MSVRVAHALVAACLGACLASLGYRFALLPLAWRSPATWAMELAGPIALAAAWAHAARVRRESGGGGLGVGGVAFAFVVGAALAAAACALAVGTIAGVALAPMSLPPATVALPPGEIVSRSSSPDAGELELRDVASTEALLSVRWELGDPLAQAEQEQLVADITRALGLRLESSRTERSSDAAGAEILTTTARGRGRWLWFSSRRCGAHVLSVITTAEHGDLGVVHRRVVSSVACHAPRAR